MFNIKLWQLNYSLGQPTTVLWQYYNYLTIGMTYYLSVSYKLIMKKLGIRFVVSTVIHFVNMALTLTAGLNHTDNSCTGSHYRQFSTNVKNLKINTSFYSPSLRLLGANKNGFNLIILHFIIRGKLYIIRCDK